MKINQEVVKRVIERHGGRLDLKYGIRMQDVPTKLKQIYFKGRILGFQPVRLYLISSDDDDYINSETLTIYTTASGYNREQARAYAERLMFASDLIDELESEQLKEDLDEI